MEFIKKLQQKPQSTRKLIIYLATTFVMIIIIAIWLFSFSKNIKPSDIKKQTEIPSLFENIKKDFSVLKENISASLKNINLEINEEQEKN